MKVYFDYIERFNLSEKLKAKAKFFIVSGCPK